MASTIGNVTFVGAGPGDPELITLKGKRVIEQADVVLYDALVHPNCLLWTQSNAECVHVGKRKGCHSKQQQEINEIIKQYAEKGKNVVRLKGGDPSLFGRLGEEMQFLRKNNVNFQVIPGVTSATAASIYAGIPLTHRELSRSVAFVTGTLATGESIKENQLPEADTLVFFMGISHLKNIVKALIKMKRFSKQTPICVIEQGTTANQRARLSTLEYIEKDVASDPIKMPALLVVGEVANLSQELAWTETLPLFGKRVFVLRTLAQSQELSQALLTLGAEVIQLPMLQIKSIPSSCDHLISHINQATHILFTSPNGVEQLFEGLLKKGQDSRLFAQKQIVAIGPKTKDKLNQYGLQPDKVAKKAIQEGILDCLPKNLKNTKVLIPTSVGAREELKNGLQKRGAIVTQLSLYETIMPKTRATEVKKGDAVVFTSSSSVDHFASQYQDKLELITGYCMGEITAKTARSKGVLDIKINTKPSIFGLVDLIKKNV